MFAEFVLSITILICVLMFGLFDGLKIAAIFLRYVCSCILR